MTAFADSVELLRLYRGDVRPFLAENAAGDLAPLDQLAELLERALNQTDTVTVGFVGESQVGKSTLINALLDRPALPSGGIGPLTAQATRVSFAETNSISAKYHPRKSLNALAFSIATYLAKRGEIADKISLPAELEAGEVEHFTSPEEPGQEGSDRAIYRSEKGDYMLGQAERILVHGNSACDASSISYPELLQALRAAVADRAPAPEEHSRYHERILQVQRLLGAEEAISEQDAGSAKQFAKALRERATGWRAPLVERLHVRLANPMLEGLALVDLPGIGVHNDPAGHEAEKFVRREGDALIVVFRNSGLTENVATLLESSGVITKLLFGGRGAVPAIEVALVVTHLDDVAKSRYLEARADAEEHDREAPSPGEVFSQVSEAMKKELRTMLGGQLRNSAAFDGIADEHRAIRERVVAELCERMRIICVAAPDYLGTLGDKAGLAGFLSDPHDTGIPELRGYLRTLVGEAAQRRRQGVMQFDTELRDAIRKRLAALVHMYQEGRGGAMQEWERFHEELVSAARPLQAEMQAYHGETVGLLGQGMEAVVENICGDARLAGHWKVVALSRDGQTKHFMSLRAALMRNGVWNRRDINYPDAITASMVDAVAVQWQPKVVDRVRDHVRELIKRDERLVEQLCVRARDIGGKLAVEEAIKTHMDILRSGAQTAVGWTSRQLDELTDRVRESLRTVIEAPIVEACEQAVRDLEHLGIGAKGRILRTFEQGGTAAVEEAGAAAKKVLWKEYGAMLRRLKEGFLKEARDPVGAVLEMLTGKQAERARRADAQRAKSILARVEQLEQLLRPSTEAGTLAAAGAV